VFFRVLLLFAVCWLLLASCILVLLCLVGLFAVSASIVSVLIQLLCLWCLPYFSPFFRSRVSLFMNVILARFSIRL
jgi:hypothetical protein